MAQYVDAFTVSAPGRVCILGEHQRHLGLPAIAMAVNLRATIAADSIDPVEFQVEMGAGVPCLVIGPGGDCPCQGEHEYLSRAVSLLNELGIRFENGYRFRVTNEIPAECGLAETTAVTIAWILALLRASNQLQSHTGNDIGSLGHKVEAAVLKESTSVIDPYACSLGGKLYAHAGDPQDVAPVVGARLEGLVFGYSAKSGGRSHVCHSLRERTVAAVEALSGVMPSFDLGTTAFDEAVAQLRHVSDEQAGLLYALMRGRTLCEEAAALLGAKAFDKDRLGEKMDEEHSVLRDYLGLCTDKTEEIIDAAKAAGGLGASSCGSGAALVVYAPDRQTEVAEAIRANGWEAKAVSQADGARLDAGTLSPPWL